MEGVLVEIISQFGVLGLVLAGIIYLIVDGIKTKKNSKENTCKQLDNAISEIEQHVDKKINVVNDRIDIINTKVDTQYAILNKRIDAGPETFMNKIEEKKSIENKEHFNKIIEQFTQAPKLHKILKLYRERIGCDHIFLGTFHNGSTSITGIPQCKFDIIAEKFKPGHNADLREYTAIYKNSDILVHDNLPVVISQEDYVYYKIENDGSSPLEDIDDILYRRCVKFGIKQIAINLLRDEQMYPVGFVGCVDFDSDDELNFKELNNCAKELEEIYK